MTIRRTRHGVVTQWNPEREEAVALSRSYEGLDMNSWKAFYECQFVSDAEEFVDAARQCDYSLNFMWAGDDGDIAYAHLGRYPDWEAVDWDTRFPADGTKYELTDEDYLRASDGEVPAAVNPSTGYSAQWNNKPAPGWNNGDMSYAWGTDHRVQRIVNLVEHELDETGSVSYDSLKEVVYDLSFVDLRAIRYRDALLDAFEGHDADGDDVELDEVEAAALEAVREWDLFRQGSGERYDGEYPVGFTVFDAFFPELLDATFEPTFGVLGEQYAAVRGTFLNYRYGRPLLMRTLQPEEAALKPAVDYFAPDGRDCTIRGAFRDAVAALREEYGDDVDAWRADARIDELDNLALFGMPIGVGDAGDIPWMNRGTENHFVKACPDPKGPRGDFRAENVLPPGESGYVAPDGSVGPHYDDQLDEFVAFDYKRLRFTRAEVAPVSSVAETLRWGESGGTSGEGKPDDPTDAAGAGEAGND